MYELPYGNTQQLNLDWFIKRWQEFYAQWQEAEAGIDHALDAEIQRVEDAMTDLYAARDAAAASATAAAASASSASNDATIATNAATAAAASATLANNKATAAGLSEAAAANSANSASNSAIAAGTSASQANASAASATASEQSATASATAAAGSATAAAGSASDADDSATAAAASAQEAQDVLDSIPEDYTDLSNNVSGIQKELDSVNDLFNYNYNTDYTLAANPSAAAGSSTRIGVKRRKTNVVLTGGDVNRYGLIKLNGLVGRNAGSVDSSWTKIPIPAGTYQIKMQLVSGTQSGRISISIYEDENTATIGNSYYEGNTFYRTFTTNDESNYKICIFVPAYTTFTDAEYEITIEKIVDSQIERYIKSIIAKQINDFTADTALVENDFRIINNTLYRITTSVASGATLIPNTNCTATTIAAVLKSLLS